MLLHFLEGITWLLDVISGLLVCLRYLLHPWRSSDMSPQICHFGVLIILSRSYLTNSNYREKLSLNSPYLPSDRSCKRSSAVINPLLGLSSQGRKPAVCTLSVRCPIYSSKGPFIFPEIIPSPLNCLHSLHVKMANKARALCPMLQLSFAFQWLTWLNLPWK